MKHTHEWELIFNPENSFRRVVCKHCPEQMHDAEIERRINKQETTWTDDKEQELFEAQETIADDLLTHSGVTIHGDFSHIVDARMRLIRELEFINTELLEALEISTTTLQTVYKADRNNIAAKVCIERNREAIRKASR